MNNTDIDTTRILVVYLDKIRVCVNIDGPLYEFVALKVDSLENDERVTMNIRTIAKQMRLVSPSIEDVLTVRRSYSNEDIQALGLSTLVVMHEPVIREEGDPAIFGKGPQDGTMVLSETGFGFPYSGMSDCRWSSDVGFVYLRQKK
ncbi:MAG: hypothetical protein ABL917_03000 [Parcubacteria group bacterium]